jgi:hypothetical protein
MHVYLNKTSVHMLYYRKPRMKNLHSQISISHPATSILTQSSAVNTSPLDFPHVRKASSPERSS